LQGERCLAIFSDCRGVEFDSVTPSNPTPSRREMRLKKIEAELLGRDRLDVRSSARHLLEIGAF
jgi:hypothetical protein